MNESLDEPVPVWLDPAAQARALAGLLARMGLAAGVLDDPAVVACPCVAVSMSAGGGAAYGYVHTAPDPAGTWWWWLALPGGPALEPGRPLCEVSRTADVVARAMARAVQAGPAAGDPRWPAGLSAVAAA